MKSDASGDGNLSELIRYSYARPGKETETYDHWLVLDGADVKVMLMKDYQGKPLIVANEIVAEPGASLLWFVFPGAWHDIGRFHLADDTFTGWYTNLCTPVVMHEDGWTSTDLFLDHWTSAAGDRSWLDEDEFAEAVTAGLLDDATQRRIREERRFIQSRIDADAWPPNVACEMDLHAARGLLEV